MSFDVFRPKCRLCRCPVVDGGVSLSEVDKDKLANWWLTRRGVPIDEASIETSWVCLNCVREANYNQECSNERNDDCVWWPQMDPLYKYFVEGWMKSCSVPLKKLSEEEIQKHVGHSNCSTQLPIDHQDFICSFELCRAAFSRESDLKKHSNEFHMGMNIFVKMEDAYAECQFCLKTYFVSQSYAMHATASPCPNCKQIFPCLALLNRHRRTCSLICEVCGLRIKKKKKMNRHFQRCHSKINVISGRVYNCDFCSMVLQTKVKIIYHISTYHVFKSKTLFQCQICSKHFYQEHSLKIHMIEIHCVDSGFSKCNICLKYMKSENIASHIERIHNDKQDIIYVECDVCGKKMIEALLKRHKLTRCLKNSEIIEDGQKSDTIYHCPVCEFTSLIHRGMRKHVKKDHLCPPSNLTCTLCSQTFLSADRWQAHFCPTREKQPCTHCGLTMYRDFWLFHSIKEKCENCNTYFACKGLYLQHKSKNTPCFCCKEKICDPDLLEKHMVEKHDLEEPWKQLQFEELGHKCYQCKIYFEDNKTLSQHTLDKHPLHFCDLCGTLCKDNNELEDHLSTTHSFIEIDDVESSCHDVPENILLSNQVKVVLYKCTICLERGLKLNELELHLKKSHPEFDLPTTSTSALAIVKAMPSTKKKKKLNRFSKNSRGRNNAQLVKNYFCPTCSFKSDRREFVLNHIKKFHFGEKINPTCPSCNKYFRNIAVRKSHFCENRPKLSCKFCNLTMYSEYLTSHQIVEACAKCNKKFSCEYLLRKHQDEDYTCQQCFHKYCELNSLIAHLEGIHNLKLDVTCWKGKRFASFGFPCFKCKMFFPDLAHLSLHQLNKHPEKLSCELCGLGFAVKEFKSHCTRTHKVPIDYEHQQHFGCKICNSKFSTRNSLILHIQTDHIDGSDLKLWNSDAGNLNLVKQNSIGAKSKATDKRVFKVFFKNNVLRHQLMDTNDLIVADTRDFVCDDCGMDFDTMKIAEKHVMSEHYAVYDIPCQECNAYFQFQLDLDVHLQSKHVMTVNKEKFLPKTQIGVDLDQDKNTYFCWCKKSYSQNNQLMNHVNHQHINDGVNCNFCKAICNTIVELKMHFKNSHQVRQIKMYNKIHFRQFEYACELCDQRFATENLLEAHSYNVHLKSKPTCRICSKECSTTYSLRFHLRVAHGMEGSVVNPKSHYLCTLCNNKYMSLQAAELHMDLFHMSSNNYCGVCLLRFKSKRKAVIHTQKKSCKSLLKCEICGKSFVNLILFNLHNKKKVKCGFCDAKICDKKGMVLHVKEHHTFHSNLIMFEHNYSVYSKHLTGPNSQNLNNTSLTKSEPIENETDDFERDPLDVIQPAIVTNCMEIKEENFD